MKLPNEVEQYTYTINSKSKSFPGLIQPYLIQFSFTSVNARKMGSKPV